MEGYAWQSETFPMEVPVKYLACSVDKLVVQAAHGELFSRDWLQLEAASLRAETGTMASNWDLVEMFIHPWEIQLVLKPQEERISKLGRNPSMRTW